LVPVHPLAIYERALLADGIQQRKSNSPDHPCDMVEAAMFPGADLANEQLFYVRDLTKTYGSGTSEVHALAGVDLDLFAGELIVLLGPSGSGKTTLLNQLGGLDVPTSGILRYRDLDLTEASEEQLTWYRRDAVGFIFQFYNLIPSLTARENVGLITEIADDPMSPEEALGMVNLSPRADHYPAQLSGGEQQRVAIARAIAKRPSVLLCDEPTGALDIRTGIVVLEALQRVNAELGTLTVLITHNAAMAAMADRVIRFADGCVQSIERNFHRALPSTLNW
jgi:putative ABC transport system ATP-binding protein